MTTNFGTKFYNSDPAKDNCMLFSPILYFQAWAMQSYHVNFSSKTPVVMATNRLYSDKIGCRLTRASNAETQLLGYIAWQWDRYLVLQNVFLVFGTNIPDTSWYQMTTQFSISTNVCFCTTWGKHNQQNIIFYPMRYHCLINITHKNPFCSHF